MIVGGGYICLLSSTSPTSEDCFLLDERKHDETPKFHNVSEGFGKGENVANLWSSLGLVPDLISYEFQQQQQQHR